MTLLKQKFNKKYFDGLKPTFVNCCQFMYLVISLLVLRAGCGIWLCQFLIIAYLFTLMVLGVSFSHKNIESIYKEDRFQVNWSSSRENLFMRLCYSIRFKISCSAGDSVWVLKVCIQQVSVATFNWPHKKGTMPTCHIFSPLKCHRNF